MILLTIAIQKSIVIVDKKQNVLHSFVRYAVTLGMFFNVLAEIF